MQLIGCLMRWREPLSLWARGEGPWTAPVLRSEERGWGEGAIGVRDKTLARDIIVALRPNPHPPAGTLSQRERDLLSKPFAS
jgi:hypothetical protein